MTDTNKNGAREPRERWATIADAHRTDFARAEKPTKYRVGAVALWAAGLACVLACTAVARGVPHVPVLSDLPALPVLAAVALGLVCALAAQRLWKRAGGLPGARAYPVAGAAAACLAFAPMALFFLAAKNAPVKLKVAAIAAALVQVALVVAVCLAPLGGEAA